MLPKRIDTGALSERADTAPGDAPPEAGGRRRWLIDAAIKLFSEKGFHATSVKDIAQLSKANVSLINFYFGGKDGLLEAVLKEIVQTKLAGLDRVLIPPKTKEEMMNGLESYLRSLIQTFNQQPELFYILFDQVESHHGVAEKIFEGTFMQQRETFQCFFAEAKKNDLVSTNFDFEIGHAQVLAPIIALMRSCRMAKRYRHLDLKDQNCVNKLVHQITHGIR